MKYLLIGIPALPHRLNASQILPENVNLRTGTVALSIEIIA
jgi:hypothetical protein